MKTSKRKQLIIPGLKQEFPSQAQYKSLSNHYFSTSITLTLLLMMILHIIAFCEHNKNLAIWLQVPKIVSNKYRKQNTKLNIDLVVWPQAWQEVQKRQLWTPYCYWGSMHTCKANINRNPANVSYTQKPQRQVRVQVHSWFRFSHQKESSESPHLHWRILQQPRMWNW